MDDKTSNFDPYVTREVEDSNRPRALPETRVEGDSDTGHGSSGLEVRCPNCHVPIKVAVDTTLTDLTCSACGSHFSLVDQSIATRMAPPLSTLGRFELIERLGVGGFGSVWKARDRELDRTVAIKIPRAGAMLPQEQEQFFREARAAAQLRHPSIVSVHEVGRDGDSIYIVSDFVRGATLGDWLTGQKLTSREAAELCAKIADALHHAHEHGVIHRDLKPPNIMIDADGQPHLMDFGLARREVGEVTVTVDGQVLGTPAYMSPEQAQGEAHTADRRSDVYSVGVILFQLLTGELPFRGNARMLMHQVINDEPPSPRKLNASISKDLETIALKCLEKEPSRRYSSAHELANELRHFLNGEPISARPVSRISRSWRWCKRNPAAAALFAITAGTLIVLGIAGQVVAIREAKLRESALEERNAADESRQFAELQRRSAQNALLAREKESRAKDAALMAVEEQRKATNDALKVAEIERDRAKSQSYRALIAAANGSLAVKDYDSSRKYLASTDRDRRGWEWRYLMRRADPSTITIKPNESIEQPNVLARLVPGLGHTYQALAGNTANRETQYWKDLWYDKQNNRYLSSSDKSVIAIDPKTFKKSILVEISSNSGSIVGVDRTGNFVIAGHYLPEIRRTTREQAWDYHVIDVATGKRSITLHPFKTDIESFAVSTHLGLIAGLPRTVYGERTEDQKRLPIWDLNTGQMLNTLGPDIEGFMRATFDDKRRALITLSRYRADQRSFSTGLPFEVSAKGKKAIRIKSLSELGEDGSNRSVLKSWNPRSGELLGYVTDEIDFRASLCVDESNERILVGRTDGDGWNIYGPKLGTALSKSASLKTKFPHQNNIRCLAIKNSDEIVAGFFSGRVVIMSADGTRINKELFGHGSPIDAVAYADGTLSIAALAANEIRVWNLVDDRTKAPTISLDYASDSDLLAPQLGLLFVPFATGIKMIALTDASEAWQLGMIENSALTIHPNAALAAVGTKNGVVKLVDLAGRELRSAPAMSTEISALSWSNRGRHLAVGSSSGEIAILDSENLRPLVRTTLFNANNSIKSLFLDDNTGALYVGYDTYTLHQSDSTVRSSETGSSPIRLCRVDLKSGKPAWAWPLDLLPDPLSAVPEKMRAPIENALRHARSISWSSSNSNVTIVNSVTGQELSWECKDREKFLSSVDGRNKAALTHLRLWQKRNWICAICDNRLIVLDANTGQSAGDWTKKLSGSALAIDDRSDRMIVGTYGQICVYEPKSEDALLTIPLAGQPTPMDVIALSFDSSFNSLFAISDPSEPFLVRLDTLDSQPSTTAAKWIGPTLHDELLNPPISKLRSLLGQQATVEFRIQNAGGFLNRYLNSKHDWHHPDCFTVAIQSDQVPKFESLGIKNSYTDLLDKVARVTGKLEESEGRIRILVTDLSSQVMIGESPDERQGGKK